jgi:hypothetical protein
VPVRVEFSYSTASHLKVSDVRGINGD